MTKEPDQKLQAWIDARKRHRLAHSHVQMARELGMNPAKLGKLDNCGPEPWKLPLPEFIEELYFKRFGKRAPDTVISLEACSTRAAEKGSPARGQVATG